MARNLSVLFALIWLTGCSESSFGGKSGASPGGNSAQAGRNDPSGGPGGSNGDGSGGSADGSGDKNDPNGGIGDGSGSVGAKSNCDDAGARSILVLDLKSGWWSGDGGRFVEKALEKLKGRCDEPTTVDYHHLLGGDHAPSDISQYGQIWLLSGSTGDPMDYELDDPELVELIAKVKSSSANLLIGAGFGSVSHANALGQALGVGKLFDPRSEEGDDLFYDEDDRRVVSTITPTVAGSPFFAGVSTIADTVELDGDTAKSDAVVASGASAIASGIATLKVGGRTVLLDAGLQRFYAIGLPEAKDTETYLLDIAATLAGD